MRLYYSPNSCALAVHIALEEAGVPYDLTLVDFSAQEQRSAWFLALNPLGRVPVLETDHGLLLEVPAILAYIASIRPEKNLSPTDSFEAARLFSFNAFMSSTAHVNFAHFFRPERWADDTAARASMRSKAVQNYSDSLHLIDSRMLIGPWVLGKQFTTADPYLYLMSRWLKRIDLDVSDFPNVRDHFQRMGARPSVQRALEQEGLS